MICDRLASTLQSISRHVCLARDSLFLVLLHLQSFDTVREPDQLDTTLETGLRNVCADLGQQVVVAGSLAGQPYMLERSLRSLAQHIYLGRQLLTSLVGLLF